MSTMELWWLSMAVFTVVIAVVATLLGLIIAAAKRIDAHAAAIWSAGKQIAGNTVSIWTLEMTNRQIARMHEATRHLADSAASIDESLQTLARNPGGRR